MWSGRVRASPATAGGRWWAWIAGAGMTSAVVSAAVMYPPLRRIRLDPGLALPIMVTASVVAVLALGAAAVVRPAARRTDAAIIATIVAVAMVAAIGYRAVVGTSAGTSFSEAQLRLWFALAVAQVVLLVIIAVRSPRTRRADEVRR